MISPSTMFILPGERNMAPVKGAGFTRNCTKHVLGEEKLLAAISLQD
jgi:hypothetical protein